uniref:F-box domain-containing protein n=1 Tax=Opuntia streptacantha TaxID=393608 RepID=A0A7C9D237_OPUST
MTPPISLACLLAGYQGSKNCKDIISSLADDILLLILSLLDLKEAARTSALSRRWRYLWSYLPGYYDFDVSATCWWKFRKIWDEQYLLNVRKFADYVNQVVSSSRAPRVHTFRVRIPLDSSYRADIHRWVNFAMGKSVKELELNLSCYAGVCPGAPLWLDSFSRYALYPSVHTLVSLSLVAVCVNDCLLESILINFPNLERLTMRNIYCQHCDLKVVGDSLKLRYLEISHCKDLRKLEISAKHLVSIIFRGHKEVVKFSYVPVLHEASFSETYAIHLIHNFHYISGFSSQLTKLALAINVIQGIADYPIEFPHFGNLKQLELSFHDKFDKSLLIFTNFIDACPVLHEFKLQRHLFQSASFFFPGGNENRPPNKVHSHLKTFEMVGFLAAEVDVELVLYLAKFAIVLEKVILYPFQPAKERILKKKTLHLLGALEEKAKQLKNELPARVQLQLL